MNVIAIIAAAAAAADFGVEVGKIRPELHSSGFGPTMRSNSTTLAFRASAPAPMPWISIGSRMISPTVMRGFSEA